MLIVPEPAITLVKRWEGFHEVIQRRPAVMAGPYLCPAGVWTIGYGTVVGSPAYPPVTVEQAEELLLDGANGLRKCVQQAYSQTPVLLNEPEHRVAAVASFIYNLGVGNYRASTLRQRIKQQRWGEAEREFHRWVYAGGRKLAGLIARRADEAALFSGVGNYG